MYYTYMIRCKDNSIYTGITTDINRRVKEHINKEEKCAKYTYFHTATKLEMAWCSSDRKLASKLEYWLKTLPKSKKEELVKNPYILEKFLNKKIDCTEYTVYKESEKIMKNTLVIKKCEKCGAMVKVIKDCKCENCGIKCCGEPMRELVPNSVDTAVEKHVPTYEKVEDEIYVKVNHVMDKDHYIQWISLVSQNKECTKFLYPEQNAECRFKYIPGSTLYAFCNKHGLWKANVK